MTTRLYPARDHRALGDLYVRHVQAMTAEGLHEKSAIAGQLAWRDDQIARLRAKLDEVHSWIVCAAIASPDDMMQNAERIEQITRKDTTS